MEELRKIDRVIEREYADAYRENLIVLDATTGQNALSQLREFNDVTNNALTNVSESNFCKSLTCSPTPMYLTGIPNSA